MNQLLQSLQELTTSADYSRSHTTWDVQAAWQRTPVIRIHKDSPHHSLPEYRLFPSERPDETLGFVTPRVQGPSTEAATRVTISIDIQTTRTI